MPMQTSSMPSLAARGSSSSRSGRSGGKGRLALIFALLLLSIFGTNLIVLVIIVAIIYLPTKVGGWGHVFDAAQEKMGTTNPATGKPTGAFVPAANQQWAYVTSAFGSVSLIVYPHIRR